MIIPSYNARATISDCLASLVSQKTSFGFEIVLFDSSADGTDEIISRDFPSVRLIHAAQRTLAGDARNAAIQASRGSILCFIDTDCIASDGWLEGLVAQIDAIADAGAVCGGVRPANPGALLGHALFLLEFRPFHHSMPPRALGTFVTCNVAMRREVFEKYGPFPQGIWPAEDAILAERLRSAGERIVFHPRCIVAHINRVHWLEVLRHAYRLGNTTARALRFCDSFPNRWWLDYAWLLALAAPPIMPLRVVVELGARSLTGFLTSSFLLPLTFINYLAWSAGFLSGARGSAHSRAR